MCPTDAQRFFYSLQRKKIDFENKLAISATAFSQITLLFRQASSSQSAFREVSLEARQYCQL